MSDIANKNILPDGYALWRKEIEVLIQQAKLKAMMSVNTEMLSLYWKIGRDILEKQEQLGWGKSVIEKLSIDLARAFPGDRGYSARNLWNMKKFALSYPDFPILQVRLAELVRLPIGQATLAELESQDVEFGQVPLDQISWYHHISLLAKVKDTAERAFYIMETVRNGWSRDCHADTSSQWIYPCSRTFHQ